jgi:hypothetical protein
MEYKGYTGTVRVSQRARCWVEPPALADRAMPSMSGSPPTAPRTRLPWPRHPSRSRCGRRRARTRCPGGAGRRWSHGRRVRTAGRCLRLPHRRTAAAVLRQDGARHAAGSAARGARHAQRQRSPMGLTRRHCAVRCAQDWEAFASLIMRKVPHATHPGAHEIADRSLPLHRAQTQAAFNQDANKPRATPGTARRKTSSPNR